MNRASGRRDQSTPRPPRQAPGPNLQELTRGAYHAARQSALNLARDAGANASDQLIVHGSTVSRPDIEPLAGLRAACHVEMASRRVAKEYIRAAREAGHTWDDIGRDLELELRAGTMTANVSESLADTAYTYAVGPDPDTARYYGHSFAWTCQSCSSVIRDHGIANGPADDEEGHAEHCPRLTAAIDAWHAEWEEPEADWEAGQ